MVGRKEVDSNARTHVHAHAPQDIKSGNVLLKRDPRTARGFVLKLADFGFSRVLEHGSHTYLSRPSGTLAYLSPELLTSHRQSSAADVVRACMLVCVRARL